MSLPDEKPMPSKDEAEPPAERDFRRMLEDYANDLRMLMAQLRRKLHDAGWKGKSLRNCERKRSSFRKNSTKPLAPALFKAHSFVIAARR